MPDMSKLNRIFGFSLSLGKIFGIRLQLHYTWFVLYAVVVASLSRFLWPEVYPGHDPFFYWVVGIISSLLFFISVIAHELAHSLVAKFYGIPVHSITLFMFGGVSRIMSEPSRPGIELKMAAAGPACSLTIAGVFYLCLALTSNWLWIAGGVAFWLAQVNLVLAGFNMIPGFPMDGGRIFRSVLWRYSRNYRLSTSIAAGVGMGFGSLFIMGGVVLAVLRPAGIGWFDGLWIAFIGLFLAAAAYAGQRTSRVKPALAGLTVGQKS